MNINDLANNLGNELVKGILGEIKVNDPSITPEKVEKLNSIFYNKVLFDIYWDFWNKKHNYKELNYIHDIPTYLKEISKSKLIQIYQDLQKAIDKIQEDKIPGGLSQGKTLYDIAKHHKVDVKLLRSQLRKGIKVELEHTSDKSIAKEIAMDHLYEDPFYYDKLEKIETNEIKVNKPIQPDENFLRKLKYDVKWFEDADLDHDNDLISNLKKLTIYKEIPNEQLKQLIKKVKSEIDEIKINNPSITFDSCSDLIDSIRDSEWMREGERYKEWGEFWDRQPSLGKHISLYYNKHPKEIPQLYQDLQKFIKDNNIPLNEIKINDPNQKLEYRVDISDRSSISYVVDDIRASGGEILEDEDHGNEGRTVWFEIHPSEIPGLKKAWRSFDFEKIEESKQSFTDKLLEEFDKGVEEIKVNNPNITQFPIQINSKDEAENKLQDLEKKGFKWVQGPSLLPSEYPTFLHGDSSMFLFFSPMEDGKYNIDNKISEIKVNDPRINFPIHVKDREDWENNWLPKLKGMGYTWREGDELENFYIPVNAFSRHGLNIYSGSRKTIWYGTIKENQNPKQNNFKKYINYLNQILEYCCKDLNIDRPKITIITGEKYTQQNHSFGGYQPGENKIYLVIKNRSCSDSARTLCHEIFHAYQDNKGVLTPESGKDGSVHENECNEYSGKMMRHFNREFPEILTLTADD